MNALIIVSNGLIAITGASFIHHGDYTRTLGGTSAN